MSAWKRVTLALLTALSAGQVRAELVFRLTTPTYVALVADHCPSGYLDCRDVEYFGVNRSTAASIHLKGQSILTGNAPDWAGYRFRSGDVTYSIYVEGEEAELRIDGKQGTIKSEKGTFVGM